MGCGVAGRNGTCWEGKMRSILLLLGTLSLCGCFTTKGFINRALPGVRLQDDPISSVDEDITKVESLRPQITFPCRVAIFFDQSGNGNWRWTVKDKAELENYGKHLESAGVASDVFIMSPMLFQSNGDKAVSWKQLRVAAAMHGADMLCVIQGGSNTNTYKNPAAVLNLTIVGGYIVPTAHCDALLTIQAKMIDVRTGFLFAGIEAEGEGHIVQPKFIMEEHNAVEKAKRRAFASFCPMFADRVGKLREIFGNAQISEPILTKPQPVEAFGPVLPKPQVNNPMMPMPLVNEPILPKPQGPIDDNPF
jgi:hypothetical protein